MAPRALLSVLALAVLSARGLCAESAHPSSLSELSLGQKAAQVLIIGVEGSGFPSASALALLGRLPVGGVVLFGFNLPPEPTGLGAFTAAIQDKAGIPLIVAIDHEGGSVFRFKGKGITRIPPASEVGTKGGRYASILGHAAGAELRALGVNMALAPVVELLTDGNKGFLGSRSYGREASMVDAAAGAYIQGMQAEGVAAVAKHFPGNTDADPHKVLPELDVGMDVYERDYLPRFAAAIGRGVSSVMLSHVVFTAVDPKLPASLSPAVVGGELRRRLGFRGLAVTDDLAMKALATVAALGDLAVAALGAGADLLMLTDMRKAEAVRDAIVLAVEEGRLPLATLDGAVARVLAHKGRFKVDEGQDPGIRERRMAGFAGMVRADSERIRSFRARDPSDGQGRDE